MNNDVPLILKNKSGKMNLYYWVNTVLIYYCLLTLIWLGIYHLIEYFCTKTRKSELNYGHNRKKLKILGEKRMQLKKRDSKKETQKKELKKKSYDGWILLE